MPNNSDSRLLGARCDRLQPVIEVHRNPWFDVKNRGGFFTTEYADEHSEGVVLPVVDKRSIVMVRVRRPIIDDETWELPAGGFDLTRETPVEGVARELREETGIGITDLGRFRYLPPLAVSAGRNPRLSYVFQVDINRQEFDGRGSHDQEVVDVQLFTVEEVRAMIINGDIYVTMALAVIGRHLMETGAI